MPTKKKKFNARFPPARIKKIMQTDDDVGKVAAPVPVIISKALEMFLHTLVEKTCSYTQARNAKTLTTAHIKKCINSEQQFDFLKDLVEKIPNLPDNEDDIDGEAKPKRRKQSTANKDKDKPRKKRKSKKEEETLTMSDESEDEQEEEDHESDDEASVSSESHSYQSSMNTNNVSASISPNNTNLPSITITKAETHNDEVFEPSASGLPQTFNHHSVLPNACKSIEEEDDDYDS